jgi:hypothetical protein
MKLSAKIFIVIAILAGIWCGSNAKDRSRWLAALGMSKPRRPRCASKTRAISFTPTMLSNRRAGAQTIARRA